MSPLRADRRSAPPLPLAAAGYRAPMSMPPLGHPDHPASRHLRPAPISAEEAQRRDKELREHAERSLAAIRTRAALDEARAREWRAALPDLTAVRTGADLGAACVALDMDGHPLGRGLRRRHGGFTYKPLRWPRRQRFAVNYELAVAGPPTTGRRSMTPPRLLVVAPSGHVAWVLTNRGRRSIRWFSPKSQLPETIRAGAIEALERAASS